MDVPLDLVKGVLSERTIYMFSLDYKGNPSPHFYICLKTTTGSVVFSCCTSQGENALKFIEKKKLPYDTLVYLPEDDTDNPFSKKTYVNCNGIEELDWEQLQKMYKSGQIKYKGILNEEYFDRIINGILISPLIEKRIKKLFS